MPIGKSSETKKRGTLTLNRANAKNTHYVMLKAVKEHNLANEPINFKKLCELTDFHIVNQFIREARELGNTRKQFWAY